MLSRVRGILKRAKVAKDDFAAALDCDRQRDFECVYINIYVGYKGMRAVAGRRNTWMVRDTRSVPHGVIVATRRSGVGWKQ